MKTIETKSLLIGVTITLLFVGLLSFRPHEEEKIEFVANPVGAGIYNSETKTLYLYKTWNGKLADQPNQTFKVAEDGSRLTEIK